MGRLESRIGKLHKRDDVNQRETGQEIVSYSLFKLDENETNEMTRSKLARSFI